ncbi:formyltransferase family protein [uncultured Lamprocystis sp.]|uniref:formyltransferase family protein n=1 Tax=uncultured Lamprocystis sp. TaxID=543132 RepID=UPI0025CB7FF9|nr:formyltransferase family protein [uncultured Lamprocystis sp.]
MSPPARPLVRVVFCGTAGLYSALVLQRLLACRDLEVVGLIRSTRVLRARFGFLRGAWHQIRISGVFYAAYLWMATDWTETLCRCSLGHLARRHNLPTLTTRNVNDAAGLAFVTAAQPDVLVSCFFNQRIGDAVRRLPRRAAVNLHPSLLPAFKGVDPVFHARLRQAPSLGVTIHHLTDRFDAGSILRQQALPDVAADSLFMSTARLFDHGGCLLISLLRDGSDTQPGIPQVSTDAYDSWPTAGQVRQLCRRGIALLRMRDLAWARRQ